MGVGLDSVSESWGVLLTQPGTTTWGFAAENSGFESTVSWWALHREEGTLTVTPPRARIQALGRSSCLAKKPKKQSPDSQF